MAYVLLLDQLERHVLAERQVAALYIVNGAKGITLPTFTEQRAVFDAALLEEPKLVDTEEMQLRRALGV